MRFDTQTATNLTLTAKALLTTMALVCSIGASAPVALGEKLTPLGDLNPAGVLLEPLTSCTVAGRTFLTTTPSSSYEAVVLLEGTSFPEGSKVVHRFWSSSRAPAASGLIELGCFPIGGRILLPMANGILSLDNQGRSTILAYPESFSDAVLAQRINDNLIVTDSRSGVIRVAASGSITWLMQPDFKLGGLRPRKVASSSLAFPVNSESWLELDTVRLTRTTRRFTLPGVTYYYSLSRGHFVLSEVDDEVAVFAGSREANLNRIGQINSVERLADSSFLYRDNLIFVANEREIWVSDGSTAGTRMLYRPSDTNPEDSINLLGIASGAAIVLDDKLRRIDLSGRVTTLAPDVNTSPFMQSGRTSNGRFILQLDENILVSNGTAEGTILIPAANASFGDNIWSIGNQIVFRNHDQYFRLDGATTTPVKFVDLETSADSDPYPIGQLNGTAFFIDGGYDYAGQIYSTDGTTAGTIKIAQSPPMPVHALGKLGAKLLFLGAGNTLYSLSDASRPPVLIGKLPLDQDQDEASVLNGREVGGSLLFFIDNQLWKTDGTMAGTKQVVTLPSEFNHFDTLQVFGSKLLFMARGYSRGEAVFQQWITDGTAAGTKPSVDGFPVGVPYVAADPQGHLGVFKRSSNGDVHLITKLNGAGLDGCGKAEIIPLDTSYFIFERCEGLLKIDETLTKAMHINGTTTADATGWAVRHRNFIYLYQGRGRASRTIARISSSDAAPHDVVRIDPLQFLEQDRPIQPFSLGDRLVLWLKSVDTGTEPFILTGSEDECPNDPRKLIPGECGCGVPDIDADFNGVMDCKVALDLCPRDPNKLSPGFCGCGARDLDTNSNQVVDCLERRGDWCGFPRFNTWCGLSPSATPTPGAAFR
jgi:ELWxxDGT repeat protein